MLKKILLGLLAIVLLIILASRLQPDTYTVERTGIVAAPPQVVYDQLIDFHNWDRFNPWRDLDTNMVLTYSGAERGVGAQYHWTGNSNAGKGSMIIAEAQPHTHVKVDLHFIEPFEGHAVQEYLLAPAEGGTALTQRMTGEHSFLSRIMCLFTSMDKAIGPMFEVGLERMNKSMRGLEAAPEATGAAVPESAHGTH